MVQLYAKATLSQEAGGEQYSPWVNLDLDATIAIALNKSIEEIEDFTQRKAGFTKTFTIPGTDTNDEFFRSAFDVNVTEFDSRLLAKCVIQENGSDVFNGTIRLNKVIVTPDGNLYEVYILEEVADLSKIFQSFNLCDLDFSDVKHEVNYDNIVESWSYSGGSYDDYSGFVGRILYPLCNTGYDSAVGGAFFDFGASGLTNSGTPLSIGQFKPWFNIKYLLDKCFERAELNYSSAFFETDYFESQFVLGGTNDSSSTAVLGDRPENQNFFNVSYQGTEYWYDTPGVINAHEYIVFNTQEFDYLQQYQLSSFPDSGAGTGNNHYVVPVDGTYQFRIRQTMFLRGYAIAPTYVNIKLRDIDSGVTEDEISNVVIPVGNPTTYEWLFTCTLTAGQRIAPQFQRVTTAGDPYNQIAFNEESSLFESYVSPPVIASLGEIKVDDNLQCMSALDFFKNIIQMFNLTVIVDGEDNFLIEPYVNYLSQNSGTTLDWSSKLDYSSSYEIEPLDYDLNQQVNFSYVLGKDHLSIRHFENFDKIFGEKQYFKQSQLLKGILDVGITFESMPTEIIGGTGSTMVLPSLYKREPEQTIVEQPVSTGMKVGFYCGLVPFYTGATDTILSTYYIASGATSQPHQYYPAINHLSRITSDIANKFSDLNFQSSWDFMGSNPDLLIYTPNNLYRQFYRQYIDVLYSNDARLFTGKFKLTPEDMSKITFNDTVYFLNAAWRLYEMNDADITQESIVTCKFLKEPYKLGEVSLVPPDYTGQTVTRPPVPTPTPTPGGCHSNDYYMSFIIEDVCDEATSIYEFYSDCEPSIFTAGCKVYTDSGCTTPLNVGRFLLPTDQAPSINVYTVIDLNGTVGTTKCS